MTTAGTLASDIRTRFGDTAADYLTDALILTWLDQAQNDFCNTLYPLTRTKSFTVSANQDAVTVPSDVLMIEVCVQARGMRRPLRYVKPGEWENQRSLVQNAVGYPVIFTEKDGLLYFWPRFSTASATTTTEANATTSTTAATINIASSTVLRSFGRVIIDSEEIDYTTKTTTTISGCRRGMGGTTPNQHASGATVTQADVELTYRRQPIALATNTSPEIPAVDHQGLSLYALYMGYMSAGETAKAEAHFKLWTDFVERSKYSYGRKNFDGPRVIRSIDAGGYGF